MSIAVCFVCLGNICRSPTAEAVFTGLVDRVGLGSAIAIDSAGTAAYHVGEPADWRARAVAERHGYPVTSIARQFVARDFTRFEYVVAMDRSNYEALHGMAVTDTARRRLSMMRAWEGTAPQQSGAPDVPDPYYGGADGFERVLDICARSCAGLLEHVRREHGL